MVTCYIGWVVAGAWAVAFFWQRRQTEHLMNLLLNLKSVKTAKGEQRWT